MHAHELLRLPERIVRIFPLIGVDLVRVFITIDVEVWCDSWRDIDASFPAAFTRCIHGPTARGPHGLPLALSILGDNGLRGVCFVESLFAARFGLAPLQEIVGMIREAGQEAQLHVHPEWVDELDDPPVPLTGRKRQFLWQFTSDEQAQLILAGKRLLEKAGVPSSVAFRAGNFGLASTSWQALQACSIRFDSSLNAAQPYPESGLKTGLAPTQPYAVEGVHEYPVTVFSDGLGRLRHAQISGSSYQQLERLLWHAAESGWQTVNVLSHSFELLNASKDRPDPVAVKRYRKLCEFLARNRDTFSTCGFSDLCASSVERQPPLAELPAGLAALRTLEQAWRRIAP